MIVSRSAPVETTDDLAFLSNEDLYAIHEAADGSQCFGDGSSVVTCTNWARYVRRHFGDRARILGYFREENLLSRIGREHGGHDFTVVDDRWIVDMWSCRVESYHPTGILDLHDRAQRVVARDLYGDRTTWRLLSAMEQGVDHETEDDRRAAWSPAYGSEVVQPAPIGP